MDLLAFAHHAAPEIAGLTPAESQALLARRKEALDATGRVALSTEDVRTLAETFLDTCGELPPEALDAFYAVRDELPAHVPDGAIAYALAQACREQGGELAAVDIVGVGQALRDEEEGSYAITDDDGRTYHWNRASWEYDEQAPGWDGESWGGELDA